MMEVEDLVVGAPVDAIALKGVSRDVRIYEISPRGS